MKTFAYHRSIAPMLWVLIALSCCELLVVHLLVSLWSPPFALILSALSISTLIWLIVTVRSFRSLPVQVTDTQILMRVGRLRSIAIAPSDIASFRTSWDAAAVKDRSMLNLALIAWPNVVIDLVQPVALRRRTIRAVAHRLDDPAAFVVTIERLRQAHER